MATWLDHETCLWSVHIGCSQIRGQKVIKGSFGVISSPSLNAIALS